MTEAPGPVRPITRRMKRYWPTSGRRLNACSGLDYKPGWVNADLFAVQVDVRADLLKFPWPWEGESFDFVLLSHFIEHIPGVAEGEDPLRSLLLEVGRVLAPGGRCMIRVPYKTWGLGVLDHFRYFDLGTFDYMLPAPEAGVLRASRHRYHVPGLSLEDAFVGQRGVQLTRFFNSCYHIPKFFGRQLSIGRARECVYILKKASRGDAPSGKPPTSA